MVYCTCGKPMEKVPEWLRSVQVEFVCNNCPNRKVRNIASVTLDPELAPTARIEVDEPPVAEGEAEESKA